MSLCDLCESQLDRPGHVPPHPRLAISATLRTASGQNAFVYRCGHCGGTLLLASDDGDAADRWTRLDAEGWR
ncbi:hypothetical protein [Cupriavidus taiwanensis]|uniref:hypothetical protein n=1 Tax=Cupriavidus taiwanensis TaxID=164546 RepID=UPI000E13FCD9|nr:hypothetical protein [Cupriavidus taiwanensis]SPC15346.1 conserved hypothetical protein [Cupriavidus taiwanensis]